MTVLSNDTTSESICQSAVTNVQKKKAPANRRGLLHEEI
jgi:hypothetical protein